MREQVERRGCSDPVKGVAYFGLLGPPCGALSWTLLTFFAENPLATVASIGLLSTAQITASTLIFLSLWSYLFGLIPAVLTGAVAGLLRQHLHRYRYCLLVGMVGGISSGIFPLMAVAHSNHRTDGYIYAAMMIGAGLFSGSVVARIFGIRARSSIPLQH